MPTPCPPFICCAMQAVNPAYRRHFIGHLETLIAIVQQTQADEETIANNTTEVAAVTEVTIIE